jgi:hypothetical protein
MDYIKMDSKAQMNLDAYADYVYHGGDKIGKFNENNYQKLLENKKSKE